MLHIFMDMFDFELSDPTKRGESGMCVIDEQICAFQMYCDAFTHLNACNRACVCCGSNGNSRDADDVKSKNACFVVEKFSQISQLIFVYTKMPIKKWIRCHQHSEHACTCTRIHTEMHFDSSTSNKHCH